MAFSFAFFLTSGKTEILSFRATEFKGAFNNALAYSKLAFAQGELLEFEYRP